MGISVSQQETHARELWRGIGVFGQFMQQRGFVNLEDRTSVPGRKLNGSTAFFRFKDLYGACLDMAQAHHDRTGAQVTVLNAGCSVGAVTYALAHKAARRGMGEWLRFEQYDISQLYSRVAAAGIYPAHMADALEANNARDLVEPYGESHIRVREEFRARVHTHAPSSFDDMKTKGIFADVTMLTMTMVYAPEPMQSMQCVLDNTRVGLVTDYDLKWLYGDVDFGYDPVQTGVAGRFVWQKFVFP